MKLPRIYTKATNVELTEEHENLILSRLAPLVRVLSSNEEVRIDVNLRRTHSRFSCDTFLVMVKVTTPNDSFVAASAKPSLGRALSAVREMLRSSISRGASVADYSIRQARNVDLEDYFEQAHSLALY